jgi:hypothetical protein
MQENEFKQLLSMTERAFNKSNINSFACNRDFQWNYSICGTKIEKNHVLLLGFNWGVGNDNKFPFQKQTWDKYMNLETFDVLLTKPNELGSLKRLEKYLLKYKPELNLKNIGYSNFCYFRSKNEYQINGSDIETCRPIFIKFLEITQPSMIISLSSKLRDYLLTNSNFKQNDAKEITFQFNKRKIVITIIYGQYENIPIFFLPHPNYPIPRAVRNEAWEFCFGNKLLGQ